MRSMRLRTMGLVVLLVHGTLAAWGVGCKGTTIASSDDGGGADSMASVADADGADVTTTPVEAGLLEAGGFCPPRVVDAASALVDWLPPVPRGAVCSETDLFNVQNCYLAPPRAPSLCELILDGGGVDAECVRCAVSSADASVRGALLVDDDHLRLNVAGCADLALGNPQCARYLEAEAVCIEAACDHCRAQGDDAYETCAAAARANDPTCRAAVDARRSCYTNVELPRVCQPGADFFSAAHELAMWWCANVAADGGTD